MPDSLEDASERLVEALRTTELVKDLNIDNLFLSLSVFCSVDGVIEGSDDSDEIGCEEGDEDRIDEEAGGDVDWIEISVDSVESKEAV